MQTRNRSTTVNSKFAISRVSCFAESLWQQKVDIEKLKRKIPSHSKIASIKKRDPERDGYASSLLISYECKSAYFGQTTEPDSSFAGYLVSWEPQLGECIFGSEAGLRVYLR